MNNLEKTHDDKTKTQRSVEAWITETKEGRLVKNAMLSLLWRQKQEILATINKCQCCTLCPDHKK